ncbi:Transcription factor VBP [Orchesella cincta]|uniref:Transcription factor VBP n=1 Tax=Orchesella cincta TaxID=48709 RepID=A0A1D2N9Z9_ORCCI|nr:Transcription factor VBP [Orchesella cincta]
METPTVMPNINNPIQDQEISEQPKSLRAAEMTATIEPLPSTSKGLTVANELNSSTQTDESSSVETEMDATPTLSTEDILKIRPPLKKCQQKVPEECKDTEYHTKRMKNVLAARNCRAKKRIIDEKRVTLLKSALEENERLQLEVQRLHGIEASHAKLENDITFLRNVCSHLCSKITEAGGHVNFPQGPP